MIKTFLATAAAAAALSGAAVAQQAGIYLQAHGGAFLVTNDSVDGEGLDLIEDELGFETSVDYDTGFALGVLAGYRLTPAIAFEAEATFRSNDSDEIRTTDDANDFDFDFEADIDTVALMANAVYAVPVQGGFTPYLGAGLGYVDVWDEDDVDGSFAYQAKAGVAFPAGRIGAFGVEASYLGADAFGDDELSIDYGGVTLLATYRFDLGR